MPLLGAAGLSLSLASGAPAATEMPTADMPTQNTAANHEIMLGEEEIADVSLATFYVFGKLTPEHYRREYALPPTAAAAAAAAAAAEAVAAVEAAPMLAAEAAAVVEGAPIPVAEAAVVVEGAPMPAAEAAVAEAAPHARGCGGCAHGGCRGCRGCNRGCGGCVGVWWGRLRRLRRRNLLDMDPMGLGLGLRTKASRRQKISGV